MLSFIGFLYVAIRVQTRKFWIAAAIAGVASAAVWVVLTVSGDVSETSNGETAGSSESTSNWGGGLALAVWAALLVYAIVLNRDYLRWRAARTEAHAWYNQPNVGVASAYTQTPATDPLHPRPPGFLGVEQRDYFSGSDAAIPAATPPTPGYSPLRRLPPTSQLGMCPRQLLTPNRRKRPLLST
ncbi:hypothetical protein G5V58_18325 [Nocardioides anomalus]|uniref:Uncharacterized protein n=1 Tax=Nocardioides anomalus TaxID=2712223 RepID=A0A6G6WGM5_9ACTN|nr:hypothetical protein [Nocardioides anomalus]QIG44478.1 hypothetical protein G5V58_18325 [Nocardioides anomalus]